MAEMACRHEQAAHEPGHVPVCCGAREPHLPCAQSAWGQHAAGGLGRQWPPEPGSLGSLHLWHGSLPGVRHWSSIAPRPFSLDVITCLGMHHALRQHHLLKATCCCCLLCTQPADMTASSHQGSLQCSINTPFTTVSSPQGDNTGQSAATAAVQGQCQEHQLTS